jgi:hypothetical protein
MNKRISQFVIADTLEPGDLIPIVNQDVTKKVQLSAINDIPIAFAKETFLPLAGGTVTGDLQVDRDLHVKDDITVSDTATVVNLISTARHGTSLNWGNTHTAVTQNSATWSNGGTIVQSNSAKWQSTYTTVYTNSSKWEDAYKILDENAYKWNSTLDGEGTFGYITKFLDINAIGNSGIFENVATNVGIGIASPLEAKLTVNGKIKGLGDLEILGHSNLSSVHVRSNMRVDGVLSALGGTVNITTRISETTALKIYNIGAGPALSVTQTGAQDIATFSDENGPVMCITDAGIVGIGPSPCNTDTTVKLDVKGAVKIGDAKIRDWTATADIELENIKPGVTGTASSQFGTIFESAPNGHLLIGLRSNDANDGFAIVSRGSSSGYPSHSVYDKNCFTVLNTGMVGINERKPTQALHVVGTYLQTTNGSGDYAIRIQDGNGRINHYWNTLGTTTPTFTKGGESAARWLFGGSQDQNPFEVFISQNGTTAGAGDAITWTKLFTINRATQYIGAGVDTPLRHLHIANRVNGGTELILEQTEAAVNYKKWNFVVDGGDASTGGGIGSRFYVRQLNDLGNGGNIPVFFASDGKIGINNEFAPAEALDVSGNIKMGNWLTTGKGANTLGDDVAIEHGRHRTADGEVYIDFHSTPGTDYNARIFKGATVNGTFDLVNKGTGSFNLIQEGASSIFLHTNNTARVQVDSTGNVGIGLAAAPTAKLDVGGHTKITSNAQLLTLVGTDHSYIGWFPHGSSTRKGYTGYPGVNVNSFWIANEINDGTGHIVLAPGTNGAVGVNTPAPNKTLTVVGDISASNVIYDKMEGSNIVPKAGNSTIWNDKIDSDAPIDISRVGAQSFIATDIKGSFEGPQSSGYSSPFFITEKDGSVVGLRGGSSDGSIHGRQYFATASTTSLTDFKNTDCEYRPPFLASTEYVSTIIDGNEYGFYCLIKNTASTAEKYYWIHINGTLNPEFHSYDDITTLASNTGINFWNGSIVYCNELDYWITVHKPGDNNLIVKNLTYRIYRRSNGTQVGGTYTKSVGYVGRSTEPFNVRITDSQAATDVQGFQVNNGDQLRANLRYSVIGNNLLISDLCSFFAWSNTASFTFNYNSVFTFNTSTNTFTEEYAFPHTYQYRGNDATKVRPFFPYAGPNSWWSQVKFSLRRSPNGNTLFTTYKDWAASVTDYKIQTYTIPALYTWSDVLRRPYDPINRPFDDVSSMVTSIPTDASYLGKTIQNGYFVSPTKYRCVAYSKQATENTGSAKWVACSFSNTTDRRSLYGAVNNALSAPNSVTLDTQTDCYRPTVSTLTSAGVMRLKTYNSTSRTFQEIDKDNNDATGPVLATLPADWYAQLTNLVTSNAVYTGPAFTNQGSYLYHLTGNLFLHAFTCAKQLESSSFCSLLQLNVGTGVMSWLGTLRQIDTYNRADGNSSISIDGCYQSAGIYFATDGSINIIFEAPLPLAHVQRGFMVTTNTAQTNINSSTRRVFEPRGYWHSLMFGVHPTFGPYVIESSSNQYASQVMGFRDKTGTADLNTRITSCFTDAIANGSGLMWWGANAANYLYSMTLQAATGFYIYNSEIPIFIKGREYKIPTGAVDMNTASLWLGTKPVNLQNRTVFVYVVIENKQAKIMFSLIKASSTYNMIFIGVVTTNVTGVATSNLVSASTIANTIYVNSLTKNISFSNDVLMSGKTTTEGGLTLKNSTLSEYTVQIKTVTFAAGSNEYLLGATDSGGVIVIAAASGSNGIIRIPRGFPVGYSVMIVNRSTRTVSIQSAVNNGGTVVNVNNKISIGSQNGVCNLIYIDTDTALISGDLT